MSQFWRLDGPLQTLILAAQQERLPQVIYWGPPLPASDDCATLAAAHTMDVTGGMLDANPELSICPESSHPFPVNRVSCAAMRRGACCAQSFAL